MLLYVKLLWCKWCCIDLLSIGGGVGSICHGYMCILLSVTLIWCSGFPEVYAQLEEGGGVSLPWVNVHSVISETYWV